MEDRNKLIDWTKEHKMELIAIGVGIGIGIAAAVIINKQERSHVIKVLSAVDPAPANGITNADIHHISRAPHDVRRHPRTLPEGRNASAEKLESAVKLGIDLRPGQTWVEKYRTGTMSA